ncbi:MAG TPA: PQQ-binding-like beta-propeller repeat protein [Verrucomicrobiae bacterium]|jgi:outer membrane protein assembly factor BamB|nr:PQQ-binding-like beta-propeller repeat protein [Verrucomicrobiae bacterium]
MKQKTCCLLALMAAVFGLRAAALPGWFNWRGPNQNGSSAAKNLPAALDAAHPLWTADFAGMSTAVGRNGKIYIMGYTGEGQDLTEGVGCFDAATGKKLWEKQYGDFLSDTIYLRYATSSPTIDPVTGNVYIQDTQGIFAGFSADGQNLWEHSMMEEYGRLTFPNGRTASPVVDDDLVITRGITANWGANGPASDRFYAFDKNSGQLVWTSTPGARPKDNSYSHPVLSWRNGKRVFYAATGDGAVVCVNARTGDPIFRVSLFKAGINSSLLLYHNDTIIAIYGTPYEPGQMVAMKIPDVSPTNADPVIVPRSAVELWHNEIRTSASSPILSGDRVYVTSEVGDLVAVDATDGNIAWKLHLGTEQRNSSPLFADGKIYAPILNDPDTAANVGSESAAGGHGALYVIEPGATQGKILSKIVLDGRCYGTPTPYEGRIYLQTSKKLYCFGSATPSAAPAPTDASVNGIATPTVDAWEEEKAPAPGAAAKLQIIPSELLLQPGASVSFRIRELDTNGLTVKEITDAKSVHWASYVPPTAKVKAALKASFNDEGQLTAAPDKVPSAGAFEATVDGLKGYIRGRILPGLPLRQDFESANLTEVTTNQVEPPTKFAYPPLPWIGARFKFEVRDRDTNKCLVKTIDNPFFQRATVFMGTPDLKNYTIEADVMSDGNKRKMSEVGVINQHYLIELKGNEQVLQISSNQELLRQAAPFSWKPNTWYRLKARVDVAADGSGVIRGKAWKIGEAEPAAWLNELPVHHAETSGCPGLFGFSAQGQRIYIDNISVASN